MRIEIEVSEETLAAIWENTHGDSLVSSGIKKRVVDALNIKAQEFYTSFHWIDREKLLERFRSSQAAKELYQQKP